MPICDCSQSYPAISDIFTEPDQSPFRRIREADSILTDAIPTNATPTKIHVDRCIIMLYIHIHQGVAILRVK